MKLSSSFAALTCFITAGSATINIAAPSNPVSGGSYTVTWTHAASDPADFTLMLQLASDSWATGQFWEFTKTTDDRLPVVFLNTYPYVISTTSIYQLAARNQSNVDQVYSKSPTFRFLSAGSTPTTSTIAAQPTTTTTRSITIATAVQPTPTSQIITTIVNTGAVEGTVTTPTTTEEASATTPAAVQQTATSPAPQDSTTTVGGTGSVSGNSTSAAEVMLAKGGVVGAAVAALVVGLVPLVQF